MASDSTIKLLRDLIANSFASKVHSTRVLRFCCRRKAQDIKERLQLQNRLR